MPSVADTHFQSPWRSNKQSLVINWVKRTMSSFIFEQSGKDYLCTPAAGFNWTFFVIPANNQILIKYMESVRCSFENEDISFLPWGLCPKGKEQGRELSLCELEHRETFCKIFLELYPNFFLSLLWMNSWNVFIEKKNRYVCKHVSREIISFKVPKRQRWEAMWFVHYLEFLKSLLNRHNLNSWEGFN